MSEILKTVLRSTFSYLLLLTVVRIAGRKSISHMTFLDFMIGITFGSLSARLGIGETNSPVNASIVIITFSILTVITSYIQLKGLNIRKFLSSEPVVIITNGELVKQNMLKIRITINMLNSLLREKNVFNIADVEYAIMENDGRLSVLLKSNKQPLTPSDMGISQPYMGLTTELVIDGLVLEENLRKCNKDESWLTSQIKNMGINSIKDVFYAALDTSGRLYITLGITGHEKEGKYGIE